MRRTYCLGLAALLFVSAGCQQMRSTNILGILGEGATDEQQIAAVLSDVHDAMESRDAYRVLSHVSRNYRDAEGRDYRDIQDLISTLFDRYRRVSINRARPRIVVRGDYAHALETFGTMAEPLDPNSTSPIDLQGQVTSLMPSRKPYRRKPRHYEEPIRKSQFEATVDHIKENPLLYIAAVAFIVVCALVGVIYHYSTAAKEQDLATAYAQAIETVDPSVRASELERVAQEATGDVGAEATYMMGEAAYEAQEYDKAEEAFARVTEEFAESLFAPAAMEGRGYVAEERGDYETALGFYEQIMEKWPTSFTGLRQPYNMARCYKQLGRFDMAAASYEKQAVLFPDSLLAADSELQLKRLRRTHPDVFASADVTADISAVGSAETPAAAEAPPDTAGEQDTSPPAAPPAESAPTPDDESALPEEATAE